MDFPSKVETPLSHKRKRVDNSEIEEQRIAYYYGKWRALEGYLTELSSILDSHVPVLILFRQVIDTVKDVLVIKSGKCLNDIKDKESEHKPFNRNMAGNGDQEEQQRHDEYVYHHAGRSSSNVGTNYEALKMEIHNFLERVTTFINEAFNRMSSSFAREKRYKQELASIAEMLKKTTTQK